MAGYGFWVVLVVLINLTLSNGNEGDFRFISYQGEFFTFYINNKRRSILLNKLEYTTGKSSLNNPALLFIVSHLFDF